MTELVIDEVENGLKQLTQLPSSLSQRSLRWIVKQNTLLLFEWTALEKNYFYMLKNKHHNLELKLITLAARILAAHKLYILFKNRDVKNKSMTLANVKDITSLQVKQFKKPRTQPKYERLLNLKNKVLTLSGEEKLSSREISLFLVKYHNFDVSHTMVAKFIRDMNKGAEDGQ